VSIVANLVFQLFQVPFGGSIIAEKVGAHVVVDANNEIKFFRKKSNRFTSNESGRSGYQANFHIELT
jgi:hypothetical protein